MMLEKFRLSRFRLTYFSISAFLMSFYCLYEGEKGVAFFLIATGAIAVVVDLLRTDLRGPEDDTLNES